MQAEAETPPDQSPPSVAAVGVMLLPLYAVQAVSKFVLEPLIVPLTAYPQPIEPLPEEPPEPLLVVCHWPAGL